MEVSVQLLSQRAIFLSGEKVTCQVTFSNRSAAVVQNIAWSSVQIQCLCQTAAMAASEPDHHHPHSQPPHSPPTSLRQNEPAGSRELATTQPKILFCDLSLSPAEVRTFHYEDLVPLGCPSTYHGRHFRYSYRVVVSSQRIHRAISTLKLPIRVLSAPEAHLFTPATTPAAENSNKPSITNPFASRSGHEDEDEDDDGLNNSLRSNLESSLQHEERKKATYYNITGADGKRVGKLCLFKSSYKLGEDILGLFNFSEVDISCLQYAVSLVSQEQLPPAPDGSARNFVVSSKALPKQSFQEFCFGYEETSFTLPVPLHLTPSFKAKANKNMDGDDNCFQLQWLLRFEFVIAKSPDKIKFQPYVDESADVTSIGQEWNGPSQVGVETMTWNLPVTILATHPKHLTQALQVTTLATMHIESGNVNGMF